MHTIRLTKYSTQGVGLNETTLLIDVQQENMNAPVFEQLVYRLSVSEATPIG
jgi:hypothetical protein